MKTTTNLIQDHEIIAGILEVMRNLATSIKLKKTIEPQQIEEILDFLKNFADLNHHGKEENILFPAMINRGIPINGGPISVMLNEHATGRNYISNITEELAEFKLGNSEASVKIASNMLSYADLLTNHISKENQVLFPMADRIIPESEDNRLFEQFTKVESDTMTEDKRQYYLSLALKIKTINQ